MLRSRGFRFCSLLTGTRLHPRPPPRRSSCAPPSPRRHKHPSESNPRHHGREPRNNALGSPASPAPSARRSASLECRSRTSSFARSRRRPRSGRVGLHHWRRTSWISHILGRPNPLAAAVPIWPRESRSRPAQLLPFRPHGVKLARDDGRSRGPPPAISVLTHLLDGGTSPFVRRNATNASRALVLVRVDLPSLPLARRRLSSLAHRTSPRTRHQGGHSFDVSRRGGRIGDRAREFGVVARGGTGLGEKVSVGSHRLAHVGYAAGSDVGECDG